MKGEIMLRYLNIWTPAALFLGLVVALTTPFLGLIVLLGAAFAGLAALGGAIVAAPYLIGHAIRRRRRQHSGAVRQEAALSAGQRNKAQLVLRDARGAAR
jgi:hypothetical protein